MNRWQGDKGDIGMRGKGRKTGRDGMERGGEVGRRVHPPQIDWNCSPG